MINLICFVPSGVGFIPQAPLAGPQHALGQIMGIQWPHNKTLFTQEYVYRGQKAMNCSKITLF
ncbi:hypothetical protein CU103_01490 [Phyllobacterium sophorae]|jgi:hypothetical protein|uniref:Uncharacterized protein n=1 Tax=Phyllobacterium sophorae TaxID=1520277 RepID=A0A2P7BKU9_9HYPH|nr:hypothetical protein CU103_01490 [Phyllobacterium sophorae]